MKLIENLKQTRYLSYSLAFYLLLGVTDTVHHFHAAFALGQSNALHAAWIGVILIPLAILMVFCFFRYKKSLWLWGFLAIATLAVFLPGFYHGGWVHFLKILAFLRLDSDTTSIYSLFPTDNKDLWFYEITGSLEFVFAAISTYFISKLILTFRSGDSQILRR